MQEASPLGRVASAILAVAALPFVAVLILALREVHAGLTMDQVVVYYALPTVWLAGTAWALRRPVTTRLNLALGLVSLGITLVAAEVFVGVWLRMGAPAAAPPPLLAEVLELREAGEPAYARIPGNVIVDLNPTFEGSAGMLHPITPAPGHSLVVLCIENSPLETYRADRYGFDNDDGVWERDRTDVAVVGDSYTVGVCVPDGFSIPSRLGATRSVLNLGMAGAGPLQELAILREYVAPLRPSVVAWVYYEGNDSWDLRREAEREWLRAYLDPSHEQGLMDEHGPVDAQYREWIDAQIAEGGVAAGAQAVADPASLLSDALRFRSLRAVAGFGVLSPRRESALGLLPEVLSRAHADVAAWGGQLVLVYMPAYERYAARVGEAVEGRRELMAFAAENGIPAVDLHETFRAQPDPRALWTSPQAHLTTDGYALAARTISEAVESLGR